MKATVLRSALVTTPELHRFRPEISWFPNHSTLQLSVNSCNSSELLQLLNSCNS